MNRFIEENVDLKTMSPLTLAFIGDGVYELFVRENLVCKGNCPVKKLHSRAVAMVRCEFQASVMEMLLPLLDDEEKDAYMRGRNAHVSHVPKNSSVADYHSATGFETLFGYVYLKGNIERLKFFFELICEKAVQTNGSV